MPREIPAAGTYPAKTNGPIVIYESESSGSLCAAIPVVLIDSNPPWAGKSTQVLILGDGTPRSKTIETLKTIFGWDGQDPFWLADNDLSEAVFDIVGEHEDYTPEGGETRTVFKIQWMNVSGSSAAKMPESADRKAVLAKYGAKFRALSGGKPAAAPATKKAAPAQQELAAQKPAAKAPPGKSAPAKRSNTAATAPTATMEEAWGALVAKHPKKSEEELGTMWYEIEEEMFPGVNQDDMTIQQFGALKERIEQS